MTAPVWSLPLRRGLVILVELDPAVSPEQNKTRPCIVVSNDGANAAAARTGNAVLTVVPLTRTVGPDAAHRPYQTRLAPEETGLTALSTAQAEQVRSVSIRRVARVVGRLGPEAMARVDEALRVHLALDG